MPVTLKTAPCGWGFRHLEIAPYLEECARLGFGHAEINVSDRDDIRHLGCKPRPAELRRIAEAERASGVKIVCFCTGLTFLEDDPEQVRANVRAARTIIEAASECGAQVLRVFAGWLPLVRARADHYRRCGDALAELGDYAAPRGVTVALENHGGLSSTGAQMLRLLTMADHPNVAVNYDGGNFALHGEDPVSAFLLLRPHIRYTHWKGIRTDGDELSACALGEGAFDWTPVVHGLLEDGYQGYWTLELPEGEGMEEALTRSVQHLQDLAARATA